MPDGSDAASQAATLAHSCQLAGKIRVPPDFGPVGGALLRVPSPEECRGVFDNAYVVDPLGELLGRSGGALDEALKRAMFVDALDVSQPTADGTIPGVTIPIHSYIFPQQKTRVFLARACAWGGPDARGQAAPPALAPYRFADLQVTRGEVTSIDDPTQPEQGNYQPWQRIYQ